MVALRTEMMSSTQFHHPQSGLTDTVSTRMLARPASAAFSRAIWRASLGMSIEKIVNDRPRETKVPEVWVVRWNSTDAQAAQKRSSREAMGRAERMGTQSTIGPPP